jgi:glutamate synthase (NADPH) small chain
VALGLDLEGALHEAERCLRCKKPRCVPGCPVGIDIPGFIAAIQRRDFKRSYQILKSTNALPAVCGRVCPQESQCEVHLRGGRQVSNRWPSGGWSGSWPIWPWGAAGMSRRTAAAGKRSAAIIGSGPSGWPAPATGRHGVKVTVFEALHVAGGVLKYGIPEFRLPDVIIDAEIENMKKMGVEIRLDTIIGKLFTIPQLLTKWATTRVSWAPARDRPNSPAFPARRSTASSPPTNS